MIYRAISLLLKSLTHNKITVGIILIYAVLMLSVITWGIPNQNHPFTYHMDEWHQLQAIRSLFKYGTPNIAGSAHGSVFHFFLSGLYVYSLYLLKIFDPFILRTSTDNLMIWKNFFIFLRLNTLIYGVLSIVLISLISKKYLNINGALTAFLFVSTPLWLSLSNYFKYDIALIFWIILALFFLLKYIDQPSFKNFIISGILCGLALSVKISALPLLPIYLFAFFLSKNKNYKSLLSGIFLFLIVFLVFGIPDVLLGRGDYKEFLYSNFSSLPQGLNNFIFPIWPWYLYYFLKVPVFNFGYSFVFLSIIAISYWFSKLIKGSVNQESYKNMVLLFFSLSVFSLSLIPLKFTANGNRLLVLLPFFALIISAFITKVSRYKKFKFFIIFLVVALIIQFAQSFSFAYVKSLKDVRAVSSEWMVKNIPENALIGIENIPIYQMLPDIIVKEYYQVQDKKNKKIFKYKIIEEKDNSYPAFVIIINKELDIKYYKKSAKKTILTNLEKGKYKIVKEFKPSEILYFFMENELGFYSSGLVPISTITIYKK